MKHLFEKRSRRNSTSQRRQWGLTVIEMVGYLAAFGVIVAIFWPKISQVIPGITTNSEVTDFQTLMTSYGAILDQKPDMSQCAAADAIANRTYPPAFWQDATHLKNSNGGTITITPTAGNASCIFHTDTEPREVCQKLGNVLSKVHVLVSINSNAVKTDTNAEITSAALNGACVDAQTNVIEVTRARGGI